MLANTFGGKRLTALTKQIDGLSSDLADARREMAEHAAATAEALEAMRQTHRRLIEEAERRDHDTRRRLDELQEQQHGVEARNVAEAEATRHAVGRADERQVEIALGHETLRRSLHRLERQYAADIVQLTDAVTSLVARRYRAFDEDQR